MRRRLDLDGMELGPLVRLVGEDGEEYEFTLLDYVRLRRDRRRGRLGELSEADLAEVDELLELAQGQLN